MQENPGKDMPPDRMLGARKHSVDHIEGAT
jgi:hypothetical protein